MTFSVAAPNQQSNELVWRMFDLVTGKLQPIASSSIPKGFSPVAASESFTWWRTRSSDETYRQDRKSGEVKKVRIVPDGYNADTNLRFLNKTDTAVIATRDRLWIVDAAEVDRVKDPAVTDR